MKDNLKSTAIIFGSLLGIETITITDIEFINKILWQFVIGLLTSIYIIQKIRKHGKT
jgi:hypothetical protein